MGVPAFYRWLCNKYPKAVVDAIVPEPQVIDGVEVPVMTDAPNENGIEWDNLYLDMNGIIHPAAHPEHGPAPETEEDMYLAIFKCAPRRAARPSPRGSLACLRACCACVWRAWGRGG